MPPVRSLVFVVNPASGGRQGGQLLRRLQQRFSEEQIRVLGRDDILAAVRRWSSDEGGRTAVVACGGDGTAAAVLEAAWQVDPRRPLPVAVLPLGTGNDLARHLGWIPADDRFELDQRLHTMQIAPLTAIDRWVLTGPNLHRAFYNYCSIGFDAEVAGRFHALRGEFPWLFRGAAVNRALYGLAALGSRAQHLASGISIAGGVGIPSWCRSLVCLNISSYAGGARVTTDIRAGDGRLDVVAMGPLIATGVVLGGFRRPNRIQRASVLRCTFARETLAQMDGEPMRLEPGHYTMAHAGRVRLVMGGR